LPCFSCDFVPPAGFCSLYDAQRVLTHVFLQQAARGPGVTALLYCTVVYLPCRPRACRLRQHPSFAPPLGGLRGLVIYILRHRRFRGTFLDELLKKLFSSSRGQRDDGQLWDWNSGRRSGPAAAAGGQHTAAVVRRPSDVSSCPSTRIWLHFLRFPGTGEDGVKLISSDSLALKRPWRQNCRGASRIFKRGSNFPAVPYRLVGR
jgi:hypothetical protein